jgi:hypothetical protein
MGKFLIQQWTDEFKEFLAVLRIRIRMIHIISLDPEFWMRIRIRIRILGYKIGV